MSNIYIYIYVCTIGLNITSHRMTRDLLRYYPIITEKYFSLWNYIINSYETLVLEVLLLTPCVILTSLKQYIQANNTLLVCDNKLHFQLLSNQWIWFIQQSNVTTETNCIKIVLNSINSLSINYDNYISSLVLKKSRNMNNNTTITHIQYLQQHSTNIYTVFRNVLSQLFQYIIISSDSNITPNHSTSELIINNSIPVEKLEPYGSTLYILFTLIHHLSSNYGVLVDHTVTYPTLMNIIQDELVVLIRHIQSKYKDTNADSITNLFQTLFTHREMKFELINNKVSRSQFVSNVKEFLITLRGMYTFM